MMDEIRKIENKIQKAFNKGTVDYQLLEDGDRILIALSGGKDSLELLRLMARRARIYKPRIEVEAVHVVMDNIPYETDRTYLEEFCRENGVKLHILHTSFDESTDARKTRCFLCSWNRRKVIFSFAQENGFNKVALGHHQDDILVTLLMNMTYEGSIQTMPPRLRLDNYALTIIRPLCLVREVDIRQLAVLLGFHSQKTLCPYEEQTRRTSMSQVFHDLEEMNPEARYSLWHSMGNIKQNLLPSVT